MNVTSKVPGDKHQELMKEKEGTAFPYVVVLDGEGRLIARHRGKRTASGVKGFADKALAYVAAKKKAAGGDKRAKVQADLLRLDFDLDRHTLEKAQAFVRDVGDLTAEQEKTVEGLLTSIEVNELVTRSRSDGAAQLEAGAKCVAMKEAGRVPTDFTAVLGFWHLVIVHAESKRDVPLYEQAVAALRAACGDDDHFAAWLAEYEKRLAALKK